MVEESLLEIGFTQNETKIYFAILDLGECKSGEIMKKANLNTGRIYDIINSLIKKGLVSHIIKSNIKYFYATDPSSLLDYIEEKREILDKKEKSIKKILPDLIQRNQLLKKTYRTEVFQGIKGIKYAVDYITKESNQDSIFYIFGIPKIDDRNLQLYFAQWHNARKINGHIVKMIYNQSEVEIAKDRVKIPHSEVKVMPGGVMTPAWTCVVEDYTLIITLKGEISCIMIKNQEVAKSYIEFFNMVWNLSK
ncbi:MAG: hypothetical protein PF569_09630 [Candidatus Woesearchaeota archaeon]|nr:hypothetical protein [Candidatus Woesearchaeota archaeon]